MQNFDRAIELLEKNNCPNEANLLRIAKKSIEGPEPSKENKVAWIKWHRSITGIGLTAAIKEYEDRFCV